MTEYVKVTSRAATSIVVVPHLERAYIQIYAEAPTSEPGGGVSRSTGATYSHNVDGAASASSSRIRAAATAPADAPDDAWAAVQRRHHHAGSPRTAAPAEEDDAGGLVVVSLSHFAEPKSRTALLHEHRVTPYSLGAAVGRGLNAAEVTACLRALSRRGSVVDWAAVEAFCAACMGAYGRARLVLRGGRHHTSVGPHPEAGTGVQPAIDAANSSPLPDAAGIRVEVECVDVDAARVLSTDPAIRTQCARIEWHVPPPLASDAAPTLALADAVFAAATIDPIDAEAAMAATSEDQQQQQQQPVAPPPPVAATLHLLDPEAAKVVAARALALGLPLQHQYSFAEDTELRQTAVVLRSGAACRPRPYQRAAVESAVVEGGRVQSGVIVVPCGGGKTLIGVMLLCAVRRPAVVLCISAVSTEQWKEQIEKFALLDREAVAESAGGGRGRGGGRGGARLGAHAPSATTSTAVKIAVWNAKRRDPVDDTTDVLITTYHALAAAVRRRQIATAILDQPGNAQPQHQQQQQANPPPTSAAARARSAATHPAAAILQRTWGLLLLDEAHVVPARYFRDAVAAVRCKATIGLTATFVREDNLIDDLRHLVGPKLYDVGWATLRESGFLASVRCVEVHVPMPPQFAFEYWERAAKEGLDPAAVFGGLKDTGMEADDSPSAAIRGDNHGGGGDLSPTRKRVSASASDSDETSSGSGSSSSGSSSSDSDATAGRRRGRSSPHPAGKKAPAGVGAKKGRTTASAATTAAPAKKKTNIKESVPATTDEKGGGAAGGHHHFGRHPVLAALAASNPFKGLCVLSLVARHRGAKILLFCDHLMLLEEYARLLRCPLIHGATPHAERMALFADFENTRTRNILCLSRVGEIAVNLPSASVVIQVSSHGGSRRQEAQRLGRVLRPKSNLPTAVEDDIDGAFDGRVNDVDSVPTSGADDGTRGDGSDVEAADSPTLRATRTAPRKGPTAAYDAYFYSLVTEDTLEVTYAAHRTQFLVEQGYWPRIELWDPKSAAAQAAQNFKMHLRQQQEMERLHQAAAAATAAAAPSAAVAQPSSDIKADTDVKAQRPLVAGAAAAAVAAAVKTEPTVSSTSSAVNKQQQQRIIGIARDVDDERINYQAYFARGNNPTGAAPFATGISTTSAQHSTTVGLDHRAPSSFNRASLFPPGSLAAAVHSLKVVAFDEANAATTNFGAGDPSATIRPRTEEEDAAVKPEGGNPEPVEVSHTAATRLTGANSVDDARAVRTWLARVVAKWELEITGRRTAADAEAAAAAAAAEKERKGKRGAAPGVRTRAVGIDLYTVGPEEDAMLYDEAFG